AVHLSNNGRTYSRAFAQWRLDYSFPRAAVSAGLRPVLAVAEAILTRGTTPLCSPKIEEELLSNLGDAEYIGALRHVSLSPTVHYRPSNAESQEEQRLIELIY